MSTGGEDKDMIPKDLNGTGAARNGFDPVSRTAIEYIDKRLDRTEEILDRITAVQEDISKVLVQNVERTQDNAKRIDEAKSKISVLEKIIWQYMGGIIILIAAFTYGPLVYRLITGKTL